MRRGWRAWMGEVCAICKGVGRYVCGVCSGRGWYRRCTYALLGEYELVACSWCGGRGWSFCECDVGKRLVARWVALRKEGGEGE